MALLGWLVGSPADIHNMPHTTCKHCCKSQKKWVIMPQGVVLWLLQGEIPEANPLEGGVGTALSTLCVSLMQHWCWSWKCPGSLLHQHTWLGLTHFSLSMERKSSRLERRKGLEDQGGNGSILIMGPRRGFRRDNPLFVVYGFYNHEYVYKFNRPPTCHRRMR